MMPRLRLEPLNRKDDTCVGHQLKILLFYFKIFDLDEPKCPLSSCLPIDLFKLKDKVTDKGRYLVN